MVAGEGKIMFAFFALFATIGFVLGMGYGWWLRGQWEDVK